MFIYVQSEERIQTLEGTSNNNFTRTRPKFHSPRASCIKNLVLLFFVDRGLDMKVHFSNFLRQTKIDSPRLLAHQTARTSESSCFLYKNITKGPFYDDHIVSKGHFLLPRPNCSQTDVLEFWTDGKKKKDSSRPQIKGKNPRFLCLVCSSFVSQRERETQN